GRSPRQPASARKPLGHSSQLPCRSSPLAFLRPAPPRWTHSPVAGQPSTARPWDSRCTDGWEPESIRPDSQLVKGAGMAQVRRPTRLRKGITTVTLLLILGVGVAIPAYAQVDVLQASIFGAQEVPPTGSSAEGIAVIFLNSITNTINFTIVHNVT